MTFEISGYIFSFVTERDETVGQSINCDDDRVPGSTMVTIEISGYRLSFELKEMRLYGD